LRAFACEIRDHLQNDGNKLDVANLPGFVRANPIPEGIVIPQMPDLGPCKWWLSGIFLIDWLSAMANCGVDWKMENEGNEPSNAKVAPPPFPAGPSRPQCAVSATAGEAARAAASREPDIDRDDADGIFTPQSDDGTLHPPTEPAAAPTENTASKRNPWVVPSGVKPDFGLNMWKRVAEMEPGVHISDTEFWSFREANGLDRDCPIFRVCVFHRLWET
jgi:hypothetical protein